MLDLKAVSYEMLLLFLSHEENLAAKSDVFKAFEPEKGQNEVTRNLARAFYHFKLSASASRSRQTSLQFGRSQCIGSGIWAQ